VKTFTADELAAFRRPFELGWRREVVLRGTVTSSGKKIGDVYYFSADKKTKLRSYVEMGLFLKRSSSGLAPENFTFARQPIYRPPQEIVRHAMQRGGGQHLLHPSQIIDSAPFTPAAAQEAPPTEPQPPSAQTSPLQRSARNSTASESEEQFTTSIAEGRAKRKRVAPSRFEDEDYSESPLKKKGHRERGPSGGANGVAEGGASGSASGMALKPSSGASANKALPSGPKPQLSLQEKRRQLQHQLLQQVHEQTMKKAALETQQRAATAAALMPNGGESASSPPETQEKEEKEAKSDAKSVPSVSARKSIGAQRSKTEAKTETPLTPKVEDESDKTTDKPTDETPTESAGKAAEKEEKPAEVKASDAVSGAPCSMHCPGRRGMLPNLMCSRCFCLYHLDCVPGGVFLEEPRVFVCPVSAAIVVLLFPFSDFRFLRIVSNRKTRRKSCKTAIVSRTATPETTRNSFLRFSCLRRRFSSNRSRS
jgi:hypothetical protein